MAELQWREVDRIRQIIKEFCNDVWTAEHDSFGHHYRHQSTRILVDSVTTQHVVDKPHLVKWGAKVALQKMLGYMASGSLTPDKVTEADIEDFARTYETIRDTAGALGTTAHDLLEVYVNRWIDVGAPPTEQSIMSEHPEADFRSIAAFRSGVRALRENPVLPVASEVLVGSHKEKMAGSLDLLVLNTSFAGFPELELWDWKTSNSVNDMYAMQVVSYGKMFEAMTKLKIARYRIFKLSKEKDAYKAYTVPRPGRAWLAQKNNNKLYAWLHDGKEKLVEERVINTIVQ